MRRIKLTVAYDGTNYCGWQIQPNGITIEEVLNQKLSKLTGEEIHVIGASRTDSGVHALGNIAVFDTNSTIPPGRFACAVNQKLPEDIVVIQSEEVPQGWHPRYQDCTKYYEYHILNSPIPNPLCRLTTSHVSFPLDEEKMQAAANYLTGTHDFKSFCNIRTNTDDTTFGTERKSRSASVETASYTTWYVSSPVHSSGLAVVSISRNRSKRS